MSHHHHDHPIIWEVKDLSGKRLTMLVKHTYEDALQQARDVFPNKEVVITDTGKRKPPNKCCNTCKDKPCE